MKRIRQFTVALLALLFASSAGAVNPYYSHASGVPSTGSAASSSIMRAEFDAVASGFNLLPTLSGNANLPIFVDGTGSILAAISAANARTNLGVTATGADTTYLFRANNLSDLGNAATARTNLGVTATGGDTTYAYRANNLSDLVNAATARTNLGVTATGSDTTYAYRANNLSDLGNAATARTNLGVVGSAIKRKSADQSVTSSTVLQNDNDLVFAVAANEEWVFDYWISAGAGLSVTGVSMGFTLPAGISGSNIVSQVTNSSVRTTGTSGFGFAPGAFSAGEDLVHISVWLLNGPNAGNITLQWAQQTSNATPLLFRKGSYAIAHKIAP